MAKGTYPFSGQNWTAKRMRAHLGSLLANGFSANVKEDGDKLRDIGPEIAAACEETAAAIDRDEKTNTSAGGRSARTPATAGSRG